MAIKVYPELDPRVIEVLSPITDITIQDLTDQIKDWEDEPSSLTYPKLVSTAGKQDLGGGAFVGITATLQNAKISFTARPSPDEILCTITAGNLVAIDANGDNMNPIFPTAYTQVVIQQSTSPSIITPPEDLNMLYLIESLRGGTKKSLGSIYYWDPEGGVDTNDGTQPSDAVATFSAAQSLATAGAGDIIFALATNSSGITTSTETLNITKAGLKVRGPGHAFQLVPSTSGTDTVTINGDGIEFEGFYVKTAGGGADDGISISSGSDKVVVKDCWVDSATGHGINFAGIARARVDTCAIENCTVNGINIGDVTTLSTIHKCIISGNTDGVDISGASSSDNIFENNLIYNNSGNGIDIGTGVTRTGIRLHHTFAENGTNINDLGTDTFQDTSGTITQGDIDDIVDGVWDELITTGAHATANSAGKHLRDAKTRATLASLK